MAARPIQIGIVEDDDSDFASLRRVLGPQAQVTRWSTGEEALSDLAGEAPVLPELAVLFVDFHLPGIDGAQVVERLRATPAGASSKIVVLSGSGSAAVAMRAHDAGADRFEPKPSSLPQLRAIITRSLRLLTT